MIELTLCEVSQGIVEGEKKKDITTEQVTFGLAFKLITKVFT